MGYRSVIAVGVALATCTLGLQSPAAAQQSDMTFFVSSVGSGKGGDFGGLAGADKHCQTLATAAGAGKRTWHAYLSTAATEQAPAVNARDRIGGGPWQNAKGAVIAHNVDELHGLNSINKTTALTENGAVVNASGDTPNTHDILTGSKTDGRAFAGSEDKTCGNWTKSGDGSAIVGHHNRLGLTDDAAAHSWNSSHATKGCSVDALRSTGGAGLIYCFATD